MKNEKMKIENNDDARCPICGKWKSECGVHHMDKKLAQADWQNHIRKCLASADAEKQKKFKIEQFLSEEKPIFQGIGAGIHDGQMYFGTNVYRGNKIFTAIIVSNKKIFIDFGEKDRNEIKENFGLNYRFDFFGDNLAYDWANIGPFSISEFLESAKEPPSFRELYDEILAIQKKVIWHYEPAFHEWTACDLLATYFNEIFSARGRTFHCAEKESGKTTQLLLYKELAFHPLASGNISGASIYRTIESCKPTILIDDYDAIPDEQRVSTEQSLRVGYKKGMRAIRCDDKRPIGFDIFSHMLINNCGGLDDISESRCSVHTFMKKPNNVELESLNKLKIDWQLLRNKLYYMGLSRWQEVQAVYSTLAVEQLHNRELENDLPVLAIAKLVGDDVFESVLDYVIKRNRERAQKSNEDDFRVAVLGFLKIKLAEQKRVRIRSREIAEALLEEQKGIGADDKNYGRELRAFSKLIGEFLSKQSPYIMRKMIHGAWNYELEHNGWTSVVQTKGWLNLFDLTDAPTTQPNPPNQPTQPNQPNQPTQTNLIQLEEKKESSTEEGGLGVLGGLTGVGGGSAKDGQSSPISKKPQKTELDGEDWDTGKEEVEI